MIRIILTRTDAEYLLQIVEEYKNQCPQTKELIESIKICCGMKKNKKAKMIGYINGNAIYNFGGN